MQRSFAGNDVRSERRVAGCVLLVVLCATILSLFGVADSDFFWHVKTGYRILETGAIPGEDSYSYTARGESYAYYSWLAELLAAGLHRIGGVELVVAAKAILCGAVFALLAWACRLRGARGLAIPLALLYGLLLVRFRLYARPEVFTLLLLVVFDALACRYLRRGERWPLVLLPVLACVWSNLHPYVIVGIGILALHALGEALGRRTGHGQAGGSGSVKMLGAVTLVSAGATLVNPYGWGIYAPAIKLFASEAIAGMPTREWLPPSLEGFRLFFLLSPAASLALLATIRRVRLQDLSIWIVTLAMAFASLRNIGVFAICSTPILARQLHVAVAGLAPRMRELAPHLARLLAPTVRALVVVAAAVWATATLLSPSWSLLHQDQSRHYRFGAGLARYSAPVAAVEFIEEHELEGPLFNSWAFGGYVIWRSWPRLEVSLDGRQMLYERFLAELQGRGTAEMLRRLDVNLGLVEFRDEAVVEAFRSTGDYDLVFFDDLALVFRRSDATGSGPRPYRLLMPEDLSMGWLAGRDPAYLAAVTAEAERATRDSPDCSRAWMMLGSLARRTGDLVRSTEALERAIALDPTQKSYHNNLGIALLESDRAERALESFRTAIALDPGSYPSHYNAGLAFSELGRDRSALQAFRRAARRDPRRPEAQLMLGALERNPARARSHLESVVELSREPETTRKARELLRDLDSLPN